jgi:SSS family solute:Na+ symporter
MAVPFIVIMAGLVALALAKDPASGFTLLTDGGQVNYDSALPLLIQRYYPAGLVGLGVTALLAGFMAGQAGNVSAFNTVWTYDIYRALIKKDATDDHLLWMGRVTTVVGIILSVGTAYWAKSFPSIMDYMQAIFSWVNAPLFATMLLGMFVVWITPAGAFWGLVTGMLSSFLLFLAVKFEWIDPSILTMSTASSDMAVNFWRAWWAWLICFILTIVISLVTPKKPKEELVGLVRGLTAHADTGHVTFTRTPEFYAILSLIVLVILNVYFW